MPLSGLSGDSLSAVLFYLDGFAVVRLIECGSACLSAKIAQLELALTIRTWPLMNFPFSLFHFPRLVYLRVRSHQFANGYILRLNGALPIPSTPVNSLRKLALDSLLSFSVLVLENGVPILDRFCPI